jgi:hypothetical protein
MTSAKAGKTTLFLLFMTPGINARAMEKKNRTWR